MLYPKEDKEHKVLLYAVSKILKYNITFGQFWLIFFILFIYHNMPIV